MSKIPQTADVTVSSDMQTGHTIIVPGFGRLMVLRGNDQPADYRALLIRYIQHVRHAEGVDYITSGSHFQDDYFSAEEWRELATLAAHQCERIVADDGAAVVVIRPT